jgi:hypothetical protein
MTALTKDAKLYLIGPLGAKLNFPVAASTTLYGNSIAFTQSGALVNPAAPTTGKCWGLVERFTDNSAGAACAVTADVNQGIFAVPFCSNDGFAEADIGASAYVYDNITVTKTAGSLVAAGKVVAIAGIGQGVGLPNGYVAVAFGLVGGVV